MKNQRKFVMKSTLKPFQRATLKWMGKKENVEGGGMLLHEAGMGKSIISLNTIVNNPVNTLIICPPGIIDNWCNEIEKHTNIDSLLVLKYYGPNRQDYTINIGKQVIYITSYSIITREFTGKKFESESLINKVKFERIILDEAHYIRNHRSNNFETVMKISEVQDTIRYRWVVTATPIFNKINDAYAYFNFLGLESIDDRGQWTTRISKDINGIKIVNEWFKKHAIIFKKEDVLKEELNNKNETKIILKFNEHEQEFYNALKEYSIVRMKALMKRIRNLHKTLVDDKETIQKLLRSNVMVYILRLKQCCDSPMLILESMKRLKNVNTIEDAIDTLKFFNASKDQKEECPICYDTIANYIAKPCGHKCCGDCWDRMSNLNITRCPKCRSEIHEIINVNETQSNVETETKINYIETVSSAKINYLINLTNKIVKKGEKIIIVSQWVTMLNIIRWSFTEANIKFISLQGDIQIKDRSKYIKQFETDTETKVCFISLMSSAEGINLVAANHLVLVDQWYNQAKMIQIQDRIHRINQTRQVYIYNLQIENTIEQQIEKLVKKKAKITNLVINKWTIDTKTYDSAWLTDVIKLLDKPPQETV